MMRQLSMITFLAIAACGGEDRAFEGGLAGECSDGQDNDGDGQTDCDDSDCALHLDCNGGQAGTQTVTTTTTTTSVEDKAWDCDEEDLDGLNRTGTLMLESDATSVVGLCGGEFLVSQESVVHWLDTEGGLYGYYPLSVDVMRLSLDGDEDTLWASHTDSQVVSQIDLSATAYTMTEHVLSGIVRRTALGAPGELFVATEETTTDNSGTHISLLSNSDNAPTKPWELGDYGQRMVYDAVNEQLILGDGNITVFGLENGAPVAKPTASLSGVCSGARGELSLSKDGEHLVYPCINGNGQGVNIVDFSPIDLASNGTYVIGDQVGPRGAVFSPDGNLLLVTDNSSTYVFDANTRELLATNTPETDQCLSSTLLEMSWSPLGTAVYTVWSCSSEDHGAQVSWWLPQVDEVTTTTETGTSITETGETGGASETGSTTKTTTSKTTKTGS